MSGKTLTGVVALGVVLANLLGCTSPTSRPVASTDSAVAMREIATGIEVPWGIVFLPGGDALVAERDSGRILRVAAAGGSPSEVARIAVRAGDEGGLLGLAASPTFASDRFVYAYHTSGDDNRIVRFPLDAPDRQQLVLAGIDRGRRHNGGGLLFGPDGFLYVGTGDAADEDSAQDPTGLNGKVLRITTDGRPAAGNPNGDSPVYSRGHRNVQGLAFDGGGRLYATEFGENDVDEINLIEAGGNYGWPEVEGTSGAADTAGSAFTDPLLTWPVREASPSGAAVLGSTLYVAALRGERLWAVPLDGRGGVGRPTALLDGTHGRIRTVVAAPDGGLWVSTSNRDGRGEARDGDDRIVRIEPPG